MSSMLSASATSSSATYRYVHTYIHLHAEYSTYSMLEQILMARNVLYVHCYWTTISEILLRGWD